MRMNMTLRLLASAALAAMSSIVTVQAQESGEGEMSFFVTSVGPGNGADLGGLEGADQHCQSLASAAGAGDRTWRAYLSASEAGGEPKIDARDRIGFGPWYNADGVLIAGNLGQLHDSNNITKETALTETGEMVNGRGDTPNMHDILTGSQPDGSAFVGAEDMTCGNWTKSDAGSAMVGHHDRMGLSDDEAARSWNSSHPSRGCSQEALQATGGNGLFYCFATD